MSLRVSSCARNTCRPAKSHSCSECHGNAHGGGAKDELGLRPGFFHVDYNRQELILADNPTGRTVEATVYGRGLQVHGGGVPVANSKIRGLNFMHYAWEGVSCSSPGLLVEDCSFVWNSTVGLAFHPWAGERKGDIPADAVVRNSTFVANGWNGLHGGYVHRMKLTGNIISYNNTRGLRRSYAAAGCK